MSRIITYSQFGHNRGRLGNMLFEIASLYGISKRYGRQMRLPVWNYEKYFKHAIPRVDRGNYNKDIEERVYHFPGWDYWDKEINKKSGEGVVSVCGWLQSSKYWAHCKEDVKKFLEFDDEFLSGIKRKWAKVLEKPCICIGVRVGQDYVDNGNYEILPILYQISALWKHFPNWRQEYNIIVFSDNFEYCKLNMDCADGKIFFAEGMSDIEQLAIGSLCTHFIIPNSTFSWWQAYLGQKEDSVVVRPNKYFKAYLASVSDDRDLWEEEWRIHDYRGERLDYKDVTFNIPLKWDHPDRMENMQMVEEWIWRNFDTNIIVAENDTDKFKEGTYLWMHYSKEIMPWFHRTKMLNDMARMSNTPYVINFDCDNIVPIMQMMIGIDLLRKGETEMVYPYDGRVARVDRVKWRGRLMERGIDCGVFQGVLFKGTRNMDPKSVGHIIMWNKEKFFEIGGENEYFISYGPEDVERYERAEKLGVNIARVKGVCYHIDHWIGEDSSGANRYFNRNYAELERIRKLNKEQLLEDIKTWNKQEAPR